MNSDEYYISFRSYGIMVRATNTDDAIIVAKSYAIQKGYAKPKLVSIKFSDGVVHYFCRVCGLKQVPLKEILCDKCTQELDYAATKRNSGKPHHRIRSHKISKLVPLATQSKPKCFLSTFSLLIYKALKMRDIKIQFLFLR